MTSTTPGPRGPLPPAVYWRRRLFVAGVVVALLLIAVNAVRPGAGPEAGVQATTASADQTDAPEGEVAGIGPTTDGTRDRGTQGRKGRKGRKGGTPGTAGTVTEPTVVLPTVPVLAEPEGECADEDISVTPTIEDAVAGRSATIVLALRTLTAEACTWQVSPESLAVKISVGDDEVWATRECPGTLPLRSVVVRREVASTYTLTWNTRRSDEDCPAVTEYAEPGDYRVSAAALGGEPADLVFDLPAPTAPAPTPTPAAVPGADRLEDARRSGG